MKIEKFKRKGLCIEGNNQDSKLPKIDPLNNLENLTAQIIRFIPKFESKYPESPKMVPRISTLPDVQLYTYKKPSFSPKKDPRKILQMVNEYIPKSQLYNTKRSYLRNDNYLNNSDYIYRNGPTSTLNTRRELSVSNHLDIQPQNSNYLQGRMKGGKTKRIKNRFLNDKIAEVEKKMEPLFEDEFLQMYGIKKPD